MQYDVCLKVRNVEAKNQGAGAVSATERMLLLADVVIGAFFACDKPKAREAERSRRVALFEQWLADGDAAKFEQLRVWQRGMRTTFHWPLAFAELFNEWVEE